MPLAVTITKIEMSGQHVYAQGYITFSGNYPTGGDTLDFTQATADANFEGLIPALMTAYGPDGLAVGSVNGNIANQYFPVQGSALNNSKIKVVTAFNTELAAGAYPGSVTADKVAWSAAFRKLQ